MTTAIYIRLSLEDGDISASKLESESITNQRAMLTEYIRNAPELTDCEIIEFCDDGYSGKSFERPDFQRMIETARNGGIDCIVVKDLSRFGRDYITVGNYISRVFPFLGVRFIAVNDGFDSKRKNDIDSLDTSFKTLIYDMYSRDLSQKVRSAKKNLVERGIRIAPVACYGFLKDPEDKHRLLIDPVAGEIVRRIFTMYVGGKTSREIATTLNSEGIATPSDYKRGSTSFNKEWANKNFWTGRMVSVLLRDRQYAGSMVWGKKECPEIGKHRYVRKAPEEWKVIDGHHDAIVSMELFNAAQERLGGEFRQRKHTSLTYPFKRKIYCGACEKSIVRKAKKRPYYRCETPITLPDMGCCREKIYADEIMEMVLEAIRTQAQYAVDLKPILEVKRKGTTNRIDAVKKELNGIRSTQRLLTEQGQHYYEAFVEGEISREIYAKQKAALQERQEAAAKQEAALLMDIQAVTNEYNRFIENYARLNVPELLTEAVADDLTERVTIYPDGRIEIRLKYTDEIKKVLGGHE